MPRMRLAMRSGWNVLEVGDPLAGRDERDRLADDLLHREGRAAAGVAVDLGQDDAVELQRLGGTPRRSGPRPGRSWRRRRGRCSSGATTSETRRDLVHQLLVDREAAGGVDDDDVAPEPLRLGEASPGDGHRVGRLARTPPTPTSARAHAAARPPLGAGGRRRPGAGGDPAGGTSGRAWRPRSSCPSPAGRRAGRPSGGLEA